MSDGARVTSRPTPRVARAAESLLASWDQVQALMVRLPGIIEQRFGIPPHRLNALGAVERGATRIQDVADACWTSVSAASRTVEGLVREGWLDRRPDPEDRRATQVTLTGEGRARLDQVKDWAEGMVAELIEVLGVERADRMAADLAAFAEQVNACLDRDAP